MLETLIQRAQLLMQQGKYQEANKVMSEAIAMAPDNAMLLAMYSEVKIQMDQNTEALELIESAIGLEPDEEYFHYVRAKALLGPERYDESEQALQEAISLDPTYADAFALWATIKLRRKQYQDSLELANKALALEPENLLALNTRSSAQLKLNDKEGAFATIEGALNEDPNNAYTHANYGWGLLEKGDHKKAMTHFKEALSQDPNMMMAQAGMAQALKANYLPYRWFLKYSFWIGNLTAKYQWGVIIGFYILMRLLQRVARSNPELEPFLTPIIILGAIIAISTWVLAPISNLLLRINPYGRYLLDKDETRSSNLVGASLVVFVFGLIGYLFEGIDPWATVAAFGFLMMIPLSVLFSSTKNKYLLYAYTAGLTIAGLLAIYSSFSTGELFSEYAGIFALGIFAFQWLANFFLIKDDNR